MKAPLSRRPLALALLALACAGPARAGADDEALEYQVKAAFVCKFGNYVEWPEQALGAAGEPVRIGVLGGDAVLDEFRRSALAATVGGRPIEVRRLARAEGQLPEGLHIVFVTRAMSAQSPAVLAAARGRPILTVTELDTPAAAGTAGIINFVVIDNKVRFDILLPLAAQGGLKISGRLLGVARRVEGRG
jgi:hypothetical protein